jgi:hypothetical protein
MIKNIFILLCLLTALSSAKANNLETNKWHDFEGTIGSYPIQLSLFVSNDGTIIGNYCYKKYEQKIFFSGTMTDSTFEFTETIEDNPNGYLFGKIKSTEAMTLEGTWTNFEKSKTLPLKLRYSASCNGTLEHRYDNLSGTDADVEGFVKHIKKSILTNDKEWLSIHLKYPIQIRDGKNTLRISTKAEFVVQYEAIFTTRFKEKLKGLCSCNLFKNAQGVMLGNGEIWVDTGSTSFRIIAINK